MATKKVEAYTGTRITFHSTQPYDVILTKLYSSIGTPENIAAWTEVVKSLTSYTPENQEKFVAAIEKRVGLHGFMIFREFDHGAWVPLFSVGGGMKSKRIVLGNPLITVTMLRHDMAAGLAVPVELLLLKRGEGADMIYQLPSGLIAGVNRDPELVKAVGVLDGKLEALARDVAS